jgi:hypothetical protein
MNSLRLTSLTVAACSAAMLVSAPILADEEHEEHYDVWVQTNGSQITTGGITHDGETTSSLRVFGAELGEDGDFPFTAFDPGFEMLDGTMGAFSPLALNIAGPVLQWDGAAFGSTANTMTISDGLESLTSGLGYEAGPSFFETDPEGGFHAHLAMTVDGLTAGDTGVWLLPLTLSDPSAGLGESETFYFVFNLGLDESVHEASIEWVEANLIPAPGALAMIAAGLATGRRRRRAD